jgi:hypothetical protein
MVMRFGICIWEMFLGCGIQGMPTGDFQALQDMGMNGAHMCFTPINLRYTGSWGILGSARVASFDCLVFKFTLN